jgi:hypothetical protein
MSIDFISTDLEKSMFEVAYKIGHSYTLANLKAFVLSKSLNMVAQSGNSELNAITNQVLTTPVISAVNTPTTTSLKVTWGAITGASGYTLQRATNAGFTTGVVTFELDNLSANKVVTGLTTGTAYYFRVKAKGSLNLFGCADSANSANGTGTTS